MLPPNACMLPGCLLQWTANHFCALEPTFRPASGLISTYRRTGETYKNNRRNNRRLVTRYSAQQTKREYIL